METIIAAVISGVVALVVCIITQAVSNARTRAVMEYQISELTKKVEKHNQLIERTYELEATVRENTARINNLERTNR